MPNNQDRNKYSGEYTVAQLAGGAQNYKLDGNLTTVYYVPIGLRAFAD